MFPLSEQNFDREAIISGKDSLREIENALLANHKRLYHLGMEAVASVAFGLLEEVVHFCLHRWALIFRWLRHPYRPRLQ